MKSVVDIFVELGVRISRGVPQGVLRDACGDNKWFSISDIECAVEAIVEQMLRRDRLVEWLSHYPQSTGRAKERVLIVMAGNIPLVGFFDLLCVVASGCEALVKPSHKDRALMGWIVEELRAIEPQIPIYIFDGEQTPDRVIATGGDAAVQHFGELYGSLPMLLRGSRHSVAVIEEEKRGLERDIYLYSGLGCRNVSMIFVPEGYDLGQLPTPDRDMLNPKYLNNLRQSRALLRMSGVEYSDNGASCFVYGRDFPQRISVVTVVEYRTIEEVERWLVGHDEQIQCVVAEESTITHPRRTDFGKAQRPTLMEYADGVDTMIFLR